MCQCSLAISREQWSTDDAQCYDYMTIDVCRVPFYPVTLLGDMLLLVNNRTTLFLLTLDSWAKFWSDRYTVMSHNEVSLLIFFQSATWVICSSALSFISNPFWLSFSFLRKIASQCFFLIEHVLFLAVNLYTFSPSIVSKKWLCKFLLHWSI
jgi:hypothetical protein